MNNLASLLNLSVSLHSESDRGCALRRDELYKECVAALQGGLVLSGKDLNDIKKSLREAFKNVDSRLLKS